MSPSALNGSLGTVTKQFKTVAFRATDGVAAALPFVTGVGVPVAAATEEKGCVEVAFKPHARGTSLG